jgi:hypothetical protein
MGNIHRSRQSVDFLEAYASGGIARVKCGWRDKTDTSTPERRPAWPGSKMRFLGEIAITASQITLQIFHHME